MGIEYNSYLSFCEQVKKMTGIPNYYNEKVFVNIDFGELLYKESNTVIVARVDKKTGIFTLEDTFQIALITPTYHNENLAKLALKLQKYHVNRIFGDNPIKLYDLKRMILNLQQVGYKETINGFAIFDNPNLKLID